MATKGLHSALMLPLSRPAWVQVGFSFTLNNTDQQNATLLQLKAQSYCTCASPKSPKGLMPQNGNAAHVWSKKVIVGQTIPLKHSSPVWLRCPWADVVSHQRSTGAAWPLALAQYLVTSLLILEAQQPGLRERERSSLPWCSASWEHSEGWPPTLSPRSARRPRFETSEHFGVKGTSKFSNWFFFSPPDLIIILWNSCDVPARSALEGGTKYPQNVLRQMSFGSVIIVWQ